MSNYILMQLIRKFKKGDMRDFHIIYEEFEKLIFHYANKIGTDDARQELNIFFIELLYDLDINRFKDDKSNGLQRYISVAIRNEYIKISRNNQQYSGLCNELYEKDILYTQNLDQQLDIEDALSILSDKQRLIIIYRYIYNYSDLEISILLGISRQAVYKLRSRGLSALKEVYRSRG